MNHECKKCGLLKSTIEDCHIEACKPYQGQHDFGELRSFQEKKLAIPYKDIDSAIFEFQKHVRQVTGGNDYSCVDSTELKQVIDNTIRQSLNKQREEILSCLPGTVVLDEDFNDNENRESPEFNQWIGADELRKQFLNNLKDKGL